MHLVLLISIIFASWRFGDWKNWQKYHATMLYIAVGNLLYYFFYHDHFLWHFETDFLFNSRFIVESIYIFIVLPGSVLILLTDYPTGLKKQIFRIGKFILIYIVIEWMYYISGLIMHENGWNMWWSLAWDSMMFPMLVLHHKKPLAAYVISFFIVIIVVNIFPVPKLL